MATNLQKYEYVKLHGYESLNQELKHISKNLEDCSLDINDLSKLQREKAKEFGIVRRAIRELNPILKDLNTLFMKDMSSAEKNAKLTSTPRKVDKEAAKKLKSSLEELRKQLEEI